MEKQNDSAKKEIDERNTAADGEQEREASGEMPEQQPEAVGKSSADGLTQPADEETIASGEEEFDALLTTPPQISPEWGKIVRSLLLFWANGALLAIVTVYLLEQYASRPFAIHINYSILALEVISVLVLGFMVGSAWGGPGRFSLLGLFLGSMVTIPVVSYLFLLTLSQFKHLYVSGQEDLSYIVIVAIWIVVFGLIGALWLPVKSRRSALLALLLIFLAALTVGWFFSRGDLQFAATKYRMLDRNVPVPYANISWTPSVPTPTSTPTFTPTATWTPSPPVTTIPATKSVSPKAVLPAAPVIIQVGGHVRIVNTGGKRLRIREKPSTSAKILLAVEEGKTLLVSGGPVNADGYTWWQVKQGSIVGWAAQDWLKPVR